MRHNQIKDGKSKTVWGGDRDVLGGGRGHRHPQTIEKISLSILRARLFDFRSPWGLFRHLRTVTPVEDRVWGTVDRVEFHACEKWGSSMRSTAPNTDEIGISNQPKLRLLLRKNSNAR